MLGIYADTVPLSFNHKRRIEKARQWSGDDIHFFDLPSTTLRYRLVEASSSDAANLTLVIAPDPPVMIEHYNELVESLRQYCNVLLMEIPGFGFSIPKRGLKMDPESVVKTYAIFLTAINKGPYILHFPCVAGLSAAHLAHHHPELIAGLVLTQTGAKKHSLAWRKTVDPKNIMGRALIGQLLLRAQRKNVTKGWFNAVLKDRSNLTNYTGICNDAYDHGACYCLASALQSFLTPSLPEYEPVDAPALVIWGEHDRTHRKTNKEDTKKLAKHSEMEIFENSAHFPDLEEPTRFVNSVSKFIQQI